MLTRTTVKSRVERKTNPLVADTLRAALKQKAWFGLAKILSSSTRNFAAANLSQIDKLSKDGATVIVPGKVLGSGAINKKLSVYALSFSSSAEEKLKKAKVTYGTILQAIETNQKGTGVQILQ
jgi:large subunit ribosomal protein L18e